MSGGSIKQLLRILSYRNYSLKKVGVDEELGVGVAGATDLSAV